MRYGYGLALCAALGVVACSSSLQAQDADGNWKEFNGDYRAWRYSPLNQINKTNVSKLKVAWMHQPGDISAGIQATPIVIDGVMYYSASNNRVFAIDAATGQQIWQFTTELDEDALKSIFSPYNRGVSVADGKVIFGTSDGRLMAVDQKNGTEAWQVQLTQPKDCHGCNFTSPPTIADGVAIIGKTGGDLAQRGQIYGVSLQDGKLLWTFEVLRDESDSWSPESRKVGGGGAWMPGQYDPVTKLYYVGTSNPAPDMHGPSRPGNNLYTASVIALEPKSGRLVWHHQEVPHDVWDYDSQNELVSVQHDGKDVMFHLNKGGFVTVLDKADGSVVNVWQFAENVNWVDKIDPKTGKLGKRNEPNETEKKLFCPSLLGARSMNGGSYSPKTGLWYSTGHEACNWVKATAMDVDKLAFSQPYFGTAELDIVAPPGKEPAAFLKAFDPITGKLSWRVDYKNPSLSPVLSTAGDLVFNGDSEGFVHAFDAADGKELWKFQTGSGIRAGIVSYMAGGKQYIVVPSGFGALFPGFGSTVWKDFKNVRGGAVVIAFTVE